MTTFTLQPDSSSGVDSPMVSDPYDDVNYASQTFMFLGSFFVLGVTTYHRGAIRFDLSSLPDSPAIESAALTIYSDGSGVTSGPSTFTAKRMTRLTWLEAQATWNSYITGSSWTTAGGDATATNQATAQASGSSTELTFDVTAMLRDALDASLTELHVLLSGPEAAGASNYYAALTSETSTAAERPKLVIVTSENYTIQAAQLYTAGSVAGLVVPNAVIGEQFAAGATGGDVK